jgi:hypothetical protein
MVAAAGCAAVKGKSRRAWNEFIQARRLIFAKS